MWPISAKTNIIHSLFISFIISALNHLPRISSLSDILVTINETSAHTFEQRCTLKSVEHLKMELFAKMVKGQKLFIFTKNSTLDFD